VEETALEGVLARLVGRAHEFEPVTLVEGEPSDLFSGLAGEEANELLRDAQHEQLIEGERIDYGDRQLWSQLRLTVHGLRWLGEWPPPGLEPQLGPWEDGYYGRVARPLLIELRDRPPHDDCVVAPVWGVPDEEWERWRTLILLGEADLIDARPSAHGDSLDEVRLTRRGRDALGSGERNPLDTAIRKLRIGSKIEAVVIAVESALGPRLKALAAAAGVPTTHGDGRPLRLAQINNGLGSAGVLTETERTVVESMLKRRNDCGHGNAERVSYAQAEVVIAEARIFLEEHPLP